MSVFLDTPARWRIEIMHPRKTISSVAGACLVPQWIDECHRKNTHNKDVPNALPRA